MSWRIYRIRLTPDGQWAVVDEERKMKAIEFLAGALVMAGALLYAVYYFTSRRSRR